MTVAGRSGPCAKPHAATTPSYLICEEYVVPACGYRAESTAPAQRSFSNGTPAPENVRASMICISAKVLADSRVPARPGGKRRRHDSRAYRVKRSRPTPPHQQHQSTSTSPLSGLMPAFSKANTQSMAV